MSNSTRKRKSRAISKPNNPSAMEIPKTFPLAKLPLEVREKIWQESIPLTRRRPRKRNDERAVELYDHLSSWGSSSEYYVYATPVIASVCRESRAVVERLQRRGGKDAFELRAITTFILEDLDVHWSRNPTRPMAPPVQGTDFPLVLDLPVITTHNEKALSLARGPRKHGDRVIQLLLAAKDYQIKVLGRTRQRFVLPPGTPKAIAKGWYERSDSGVVSVHDMAIWRELKSIATAVNLPWKMADTMLDVGSPDRQHLIDRALKPLRDLWGRHDARQRRAGMEEAKPLPKIDVILRVQVDICVNQGGQNPLICGEVSFDYMDEMLRYRRL
ncbi:hypothetical protein OQA88_6669 [Cercophora sp. LCS_1]